MVPVALDGTTDVGGEGATTMLGATVKEVALSVPVGLMLCGAALVAVTMAGISVLLAEVAEPETAKPEAVVVAETEPDAVASDSDAALDPVTEPVADAVADSMPDAVPEVTDAVADAVPETVAEV